MGIRISSAGLSQVLGRGASCIDQLGLGVLGVECISGAIYIPASNELQDGRATDIGLLMQFPGFL